MHRSGLIRRTRTPDCYGQVDASRNSEGPPVRCTLDALYFLKVYGHLPSGSSNPASPTFVRPRGPWWTPDLVR
jgi:hypothetical protein